MTAGVTVRKKKDKPRREPRSSDEIRCEYVMQLWEEMERLQDEDDQEMTKFLTTADRTVSADEVYWSYAGRDEFFNEMMDAGECEFIHENVFAFRMPKHFGCSKRDLELFNVPDVCWSLASVSIGIRDELVAESSYDRCSVDPAEWDGHLVITVVLVDG